MRPALAIAALALLELAGPPARAQGNAAVAAPPDAGAAALPSAGPAVAAAAPLAPPKPLPPIPRGLGRVTGRITLQGAPPPLPAIDVARASPPGPTSASAPGNAGRDLRACGLSQPDLSLQLGPGGGVLETLLWAVDGPAPIKGAHPAARVAIEGCRFQPRLVVTTAGAELTLVNRDALYHNVTGTGIASFSYALVLKDHELPMRLKKPGLLTLESKLRSWMKGYVQVLPTTAWSITDTDGSYFIDLPPGKHTIMLWHERLGEREATVDIVAGETTPRDFALEPQ